MVLHQHDMLPIKLDKLGVFVARMSSSCLPSSGSDTCCFKTKSSTSLAKGMKLADVIFYKTYQQDWSSVKNWGLP